MVKGKIEGKESREGFYEVKSSSISDFVKGIPDSDSTIEGMLTQADGK